MSEVRIARYLASAVAWAGEDQVRLRANLGPTMTIFASGQANFRNRRDRSRRQFSVTVAGLAANQPFNVIVNGETVGQIITDDLGSGILDFHDGSEAERTTRATRFPKNFPTLVGGESIAVGGDLSGTFHNK